MSKIVVTDGFTLNPGDLRWDRFNALGQVVIYDRTSADEIHDRCAEATVIITNKTPIGPKVISRSKNLKVIAVTATGYNVVDTASAKAAGILVCNVPGYGTDSVAQHTFALILELSNHVGKNSISVSNGEWAKALDWSYTKAPIIELADKTLGIIGYGNIGQKVAAIAVAFGMEVVYYNRSVKAGLGSQVSLEVLFAQSDFVSLHLPLQPGNEGFVNSRLLSLMKPSSFLINTSRGQLLNENDLFEFLSNRRIAGAGLDVLSNEPPAADHKLVGLENCIITPHNAWISREARLRIMETTYENIRLALQGKPQNLVNP